MKIFCIPALAMLGALALPLVAQQERPVAAPVEASAAKVEPYKIGATIDEKLVLTDIDGKTVSFKELRNKVVLLHFWSVQCPYEKVADPKMVALEKRWASNKDVVVIAVNSNDTEIGKEAQRNGDPARPFANIRDHLKSKEMDFRVFVDHGNVLADKFGGKSTPHCFVIDQKGVLRYAGALDDDPQGDKGEATKQYARDAVEAVVAGKEPPATETKPYGCSIKRVKPAAKP